jgi:hypothetical protein
MSRLIHVCPDCHLELDPKDDGQYALCPACAVPLREEFRNEQETSPGILPPRSSSSWC